MNPVTAAHVITSRLEPRPGAHDELVALLRRYAVRIHAEPGCLHYSVHRDPDEKGGALTIVQAYTTAESFHEHATWMRSKVPELVALLAVAPAPPILLEQVILSGNTKEAFAGLF